MLAGVDVPGSGASAATVATQEAGDAAEAGQARRGGDVRPIVHEAAPGADRFRTTW